MKVEGSVPDFDPCAGQAPSKVYIPSTRGTVAGFSPDLGPVSGPYIPASEYESLPFVQALRDCRACPARLEALQVVPGIGPLDARILVIGQNPGEEEDRAGQPFVGTSGEEFNVWLKILGLAREKLVVTNVVKCHTAGNRVPRPKEIKACADLWLPQELSELKRVSVLMPLGKPAVTALLGKSAPPMTPITVHHYIVRALDREFRVFPLPHPAYLLRVKHMAAMFYETILGQLKLTLQQEVPEAYTWSKL